MLVQYFEKFLEKLAQQGFLAFYVVVDRTAIDTQGAGQLADTDIAVALAGKQRQRLVARFDRPFYSCILLHVRRRSMLCGPIEGNFAIWKAVFYARGAGTALGKSLGRLAKWKIPHHLPSPHHAGHYREEKAHHGSIQPRRLGGAHAVAL
ncbi:hypothetical protein [Pseudomonas sp. 10-1B]|uniref:hypothetical protein n=1 Tax=Pseudomonas sp. 10-1B TaxID=1546029 RepID=UPI001F2DE2EE|nr:hypothetical protein [Pseudomonas sp. 10-1B]